MRLVVLSLLALAACQESDVTREVGARCNSADECDERCLGPSSDWPSGFCTVHCEGDLECPISGAVCIDEEGGVCAFSCVTDAGCTFLGPGYYCKERDARATGSKRMVCRGS